VSYARRPTSFIFSFTLAISFFSAGRSILTGPCGP